MSQYTDDEILRAAQEAPVDEAENHYAKQGLRLGMAVAVVVIIVMFLVEYIIEKRVDFGKPVILGLMASIADLSDGLKNGRKKFIIIGVVEAMFTLVMLICYIGAFVV